MRGTDHITRGAVIAGTMIGITMLAGGFVLTAGDDASRLDRARATANTMTLGELVGQRIVSGYIGGRPTKSLLRAIRRGQVGGVILFKDNVPSKRSARRATRRLQREARIGKRPYLFVMVDQEGGDVKRLASIPPTRSAWDVGSSRDPAAVAYTEARATGEALRALGFNVNLAPVADVPDGTGSFLGSRAYSREPKVVADAACAFVRGLAGRKVAGALKHFPGLGRARANTDLRPVTVGASSADLQRDLAPYRRCGGASPMVMLSSATYPSLGIDVPAVLSPETYRLLGETGFSGLIISDALDTPSLKSQRPTERRAVQAGVDLLLFAQTRGAAASAYRNLLADARAGTLPVDLLRADAASILVFKDRLQRGEL